MLEGFSFFLVIVGGLSTLALSYVFLVATGVAITRARSARLSELVAEHTLGAQAAQRVLARSEHYLLCSQFLLFLVTLVLGFVIGASFLGFSGLELGGLVATEPVVYPWALLLLGFGIFIPLTLLGAQAAKGVTFHHPEITLCMLSLPLLICSWVLSPAVRLVAASSARFLKQLDLDTPPESECAVSAEEISEMVEASTEAGTLPQGEGSMLKGVFSFADMIVREVMTPRKDIVYVYQESSLAELRDVFLREGLSRLLVVGNDLDDVKGILLAKDLLPYLGQQPLGFDVAKLLRKPLLVPGSKSLDDLLQDFRKGAVQLAVVVDELGGVEGLVTVEDLIEEIVGDIYDEHDSPSDEVTVRRLKNGDLLVDGSASVKELNEKFGFEFPLGDYDTFAGFVLERLGHIPVSGESFSHDGTRVLVAQVEQARIVSLRLCKEKKANEIRLVKSTPSTESLAKSSQVEPDDKTPKRVGI